MIIITPKISVKPNYFVTYNHYDSTNTFVDYRPKEFILPDENKHHGIVSYKANKRVRLAIDWLLYVAKDKKLVKHGVETNFLFKVNFITLTLSSKQIHSDNEIKKTCLNQFLTEMRQKYKCVHYLWRAEAQRNGNIHFHIVSDVFIPWRALRSDWNRIQNKLGYIDRFTAKTGLTDPNSTDIHSVNKIKNLSAYLAKYCGKNAKGYVVMVSKAFTGLTSGELICNYIYKAPQKGAHFFRQIHGKLWGLSQELSRLKSAVHEINDSMRAEYEWLQKKFPKKITFLDRVSIYKFNAMELLKLKCFNLGKIIGNYVAEITKPKPIPEPPPVPIPIFVSPKPISYIQKAFF